MDADQMRSLVTSTASRLHGSWIAMVRGLRAANPVDDLTTRVMTGLKTGRYDVLSGVDVAGRQLAAGWHGAYIAAGSRTAQWLGDQVDKANVRKAEYVFDPTDPPSVRWAQQNELRMISEVSEETRAIIHAILLDGAKTSAPPAEMAAEIEQSIGLTSYQVSIVDNYRSQLEDGEFSAALRRELSSGHSDRVIASAMRASRPLAKEQIATAVERYRKSMVAKRAMDIARTEGLRVAHQGNQEVFRQAVERGLLNPDAIERTWNHHHRPGERTFHEDMDGQVRGYDEPFVSGLGSLLLYPADPKASAKETVNCTCAVSTRVKRLSVRSPSTMQGQRQVRPSVQADDGSVDVDVSDLGADVGDGSVDIDVSDL